MCSTLVIYASSITSFLHKRICKEPTFRNHGISFKQILNTGTITDTRSSFNGWQLSVRVSAQSKISRTEMKQKIWKLSRQLIVGQTCGLFSLPMKAFDCVAGKLGRFIHLTVGFSVLHSQDSLTAGHSCLASSFIFNLAHIPTSKTSSASSAFLHASILHLKISPSYPASWTFE